MNTTPRTQQYRDGLQRADIDYHEMYESMVHFSETLEDELFICQKECSGLKAALADIKHKVSSNKNFSADEIVMAIDNLIGRYSQGPIWLESQVIKELTTDIAVLQEKIATLLNVIDLSGVKSVERELCSNCEVGHYLPSGKCDHCDVARKKG